MASIGEEFNSDGHEHVAFGPVPTGTYELVIVKSEVKDTKAGDGNYASFDMQIISEGDGYNRHVFQNITLNNPKEKAVAMGRRQLADLCRACGKGSIRDTAELHDIPFTAKVGIEAGKNGYEPKNKILEFFPAASATAHIAKPAAASAPRAAVAAPRASTAPARKPWEKATA